MKIKFGYCCISVLHERLRCNRCSTKTYLEKHSAVDCKRMLLEKANHNLVDLKELLIRNYKSDILSFRVSEQLLPQIDLGYYSIYDVKEKLKEVGEIANKLKLQLSTHPSQYFVLNSRKEDVVARTIHSLNLFAQMLERMELVRTPNIVLHVGMKSSYESSGQAIEAFCENFQRLSASAKEYLVIENDPVSFTVQECLKIYEMVGIPVVFDNKHFHWNKGDLSYQEAVKKAVNTWQDRVPKVHLASDKDSNRHAHDDFIHITDYLELETALEKSGINECYVMLECKQKDRAILELRRRISELDP